MPENDKCNVFAGLMEDFPLCPGHRRRYNFGKFWWSPAAPLPKGRS